jgi:hypothetical protein
MVWLCIGLFSHALCSSKFQTLCSKNLLEKILPGMKISLLLLKILKITCVGELRPTSTRRSLPVHSPILSSSKKRYPSTDRIVFRIWESFSEPISVRSSPATRRFLRRRPPPDRTEGRAGDIRQKPTERNSADEG